MSSREETVRFILAASKDDLDFITNAVERRREAFAVQHSLNFSPGDKVWFDARRRGIITGEVIKMNAKSAKVKSVAGLIWTVAPSLLNHVVKP
jgi:hypothetical protein